MPDHSSALSVWETFYVIVGSSGGALIGLQFVVITLIANRRQRTQTGALSAFGTRDGRAPGRRAARVRDHERAVAVARAVIGDGRNRRDLGRRLRSDRDPPRTASDGLQTRLGRLVVVCGVAVRRLRRAGGDGIPPAHLPAQRAVRHRSGRPRPADDWHSQRLGHGDAPGRFRTRWKLKTARNTPSSWLSKKFEFSGPRPFIDGEISVERRDSRLLVDLRASNETCIGERDRPIGVLLQECLDVRPGEFTCRNPPGVSCSWTDRADPS
jgi:hypothetical protein